MTRIVAENRSRWTPSSAPEQTWLPRPAFTPLDHADAHASPGIVSEGLCWTEDGVGHDFRQIPVHSSAKDTQACPLSLASPRACPFGGACHTCPMRLQTKLTISEPGDEYEQEADRMADQVMRTPEPSPPASNAASTTPVAREGYLQKRLQANTTDGSAKQLDQPFVPQIADDVLRSPGQPLDPETRVFLEPRFGCDFSQVRIHADRQAGESALAVNALAYTVGSRVVFGTGQYLPGTNRGLRLLAHELTHVAQQSGGGSSAPELQRRETKEAAGGTGSPLLHDCATWPRAGNLSTILTTAAASANQAVRGLEALVGHWGTPPASPLEQATAMGLRRGFNMEPDKSDWAELGIATPDEITALEARDRPAAQTILTNFRQIAGDAPNYQGAPACTNRLVSGNPCLGCVDAAHTRCRNDAQAFVMPQMIGQPSSPIFFCDAFFTGSVPQIAEKFLHEVAHLQPFAASDKVDDIRYYGCPVAPIDPGGRGLRDPNEFIRIADSYRCFLETQRESKTVYEERERASRRAEEALPAAPEASPEEEPH